MRLNMPWKLVAEYRTPMTFWIFPIVMPAYAMLMSLVGRCVCPHS